MALKFTSHTCAPDWEDYVGITGDDNTAYTDWDIIERKLGKWGYPHMESAGRILGYASLIQHGIAEACESRAQDEKHQRGRRGRSTVRGLRKPLLLYPATRLGKARFQSNSIRAAMLLENSAQ